MDYFPSKLAIGKSFCNRQQEKKLLKEDIQLGRHVVLISPRRYGKSSLANQVVKEVKYPFASIDLFLAHNDRAIIKRMLDGIAKAISQVMTPSQKTLAIVQKCFANFKISLNVAGFGIQAAFGTADIDVVEQVFDSLQALDELARLQKAKVVMFIDEFQDIINAQSAKSIQGAIRHVAQETNNIIFIFSGSNRHLLLELFDDKSLPLYMLCDKIYLERIASNDYIPHLQAIAVKQWGKQIELPALKRILILTELHSFYVNMLCSLLWRDDKIPTVNAAMTAWKICYRSEERRLISDLEKLTPNQQEILKALSIQATSEPTGKQFISAAGLSSSSMKAGIEALLQKDMIYKVKTFDPLLESIKPGQYRVLDPLLAFALRQYY